MESIDEFITEWQDSSDEVYSDYIDFFINKTIFDYKDCLMVMKEMRKKLNAQGLDKIKIMMRVRCGHSKKIQLWGEDFVSRLMLVFLIKKLQFKIRMEIMKLVLIVF